MDETTFQMYDRIVSTLFNDGVVKFGRILTLFVSTRRLCKKYPDFLPRGIKYNIFGLIPKTSYVTQTLNIKYRGTIEPRAIIDYLFIGNTI
jgi:hypothetical protein